MLPHGVLLPSTEHSVLSLVCVLLNVLQAEPRAQLSLASRSASQNLKISPQDLILYSAKVSTARAVDMCSLGGLGCCYHCLCSPAHPMFAAVVSSANEDSSAQQPRK